MFIDNYENQLLSLLDVFIACVLSGAVGFEREMHHKPAGFRTQMIVGGASAFLVRLADVAIDRYEVLHKEVLDADPIRIIQAIIIGISFIGAGTIVKQKGDKDIAYLTTAATTLFSAGIGIGVGFRQYILSVGVTLLVVLVNSVGRRLKP
jgi:putative Mg2+ transporter-C (MgtC) family protein